MSTMPPPPPPPGPPPPSLTQAALARLRVSSTSAPGGARLFTSDLSVDEFLLIRDAGFEPLGLVMGSSVYHVGLQAVGWRESTELTVLTSAMYNARELAMSRMQAEAEALGADGIVSVRIEIPHGGYGHFLDFVAIGTAIKARENSSAWRTPAGRAFSSDLSGQEFWKLRLAGFIPVSFVLGVCVYHVAHQTYSQMKQIRGQNIEVEPLTQATYDARELAMTRVQAEAERVQANGIVGVRVAEHGHTWGGNATEFLAIGTAVRKVEEHEHVIASPMVVSLDSTSSGAARTPIAGSGSSTSSTAGMSD